MTVHSVRCFTLPCCEGVGRCDEILAEEVVVEGVMRFWLKR